MTNYNNSKFENSFNSVVIKSNFTEKQKKKTAIGR